MASKQQVDVSVGSSDFALFGHTCLSHYPEDGMRKKEEKLSPEDKSFYDKYGRLPPPKKDLLSKRLKGGDRKYFDSGDYALSKAGKSSEEEVGVQHPSPERIPHSVPPNLKKDANPSVESSLIHEAKNPATQ
ncbi:camp-regulated phosphoprotein/endosulfine conserved region-domain-containing protein [Gaertneriomyces semiglobifer]|nr:camp-regulated phosphoprotein/endosulfine conserved region-domain-containing protein [Gaertneriomyces semiglobifer]